MARTKRDVKPLETIQEVPDRPVYEDRREKRRPGRRKARRWVVELTLSWLSRCPALLVRYDKPAENYPGLIQLACGLLWYRRLHRTRAA